MSTLDEPLNTWEDASSGLLKAADRLVNGERDRTYGHPWVHHSRTATFWSEYLGVTISPEQVSILFILDKISRLMETEKVDTVLDIAGYAQVHAKVMGFQEKLGNMGVPND